MKQARTFTRTPEIEELTNLYFIHPIAASVTFFLARRRVKPNTVSFAGMLCGVLSGLAYNGFQDLRYAAAGFVLMIAWHILDGVDGQLARLTNQQSDLGKVFDGICDDVTFLAVYLGLGLAISVEYGVEVWFVIAAAAAAHFVQAAVYEHQRQEYDIWGWGRKSAEPPAAGETAGRRSEKSWPARVALALGDAYFQVQRRAAGATPELREKFSRALEAHPEREPAIRERYRKMFAGPVRTWSVMSSNYRTLAIFMLAAAKVPILYFLAEIFLLTPVMLFMNRKQQARNRAFTKYLDEQLS